MNIGIIGAGNIGSTLARHCVTLGHDVRIANSRGPETLSELAEDLGAKALPANEVANGTDLLILTIPFAKVAELPDDVLEGLNLGASVIDTNNYYPQRDGVIDAVLEEMTESRWIEFQIGHPVVKVFNNIYAEHLATKGTAPGTARRLALPVAGDDVIGKALIMQLVNAMGFDPVDAGGIDDSWRQQPGTPCYGADLTQTELETALQSAPRERSAEFRP